MRNPWESWLNALSAPESTYRQGVQQWQQSVSSFWSMPASYWQTVSAIYDGRARTIAQLWEAYPSTLTQLGQAQTAAEWMEMAQKTWGHWWSESLKHAATAQTHRMNLLLEWKHQTERMLPPAMRFESSTSLMNGWMKTLQDWQPTAYTFQKAMQENPWVQAMSKAMPSTSGTVFNPFQAITAPSSYMDTPVNMMRNWFQMCQSTMDATQCNWQAFRKANDVTDMGASVKPMAPKETAKPVVAPSAPKGEAPKEALAKPAPARVADVKAPVEPKPAPKAESEPAAPVRAVPQKSQESSQLALLTPPSAPEPTTPGLTGAPHHSSTASNGVVRASGAVVSTAAAAAARRSVVARRASRSRPRIVRPAR